jgi:hypothetical protein
MKYVKLDLSNSLTRMNENCKIIRNLLVVCYLRFGSIIDELELIMIMTELTELLVTRLESTDRKKGSR